MDLKIFGPVWDGAGIRGFAKEGYWYHALVPGLSPQLARSTFVTKTITTDRTKGHMELDSSFRPVSLKPDCIYLDFRHGLALNAIGLSGPSIRAILSKTQITNIQEPFFISYMPVLSGSSQRARTEVRDFIHDIEKWRPIFRTRQLGIQLNISCPNVHADLKQISSKAGELLDQFTRLHRPVVVKLNLLIPPEEAARIAAHPTCTGLCIANSVPFGTVLPPDWWQQQFPNGSPLARYGGGGLSGAPIFPHVLEWLRKFRTIDHLTYVNTGGGIMKASDVDELYTAGADSIFFSSVMMLRPWRVGSIIKRAYELFNT